MPLSRIAKPRHAVGKFNPNRSGAKSYGAGAPVGRGVRKAFVPGYGDKTSNVAISAGIKPNPKIAVGKKKGVAGTAAPASGGAWDGGPADTDPIPKEAEDTGGGGGQADEQPPPQDDNWEQAAQELENESDDDDDGEEIEAEEDEGDEREEEQAASESDATVEGEGPAPSAHVKEGGVAVPLQASHLEDGILHTAALAFDMNGAHYVLVRIPCPCAHKGTIDFAGEAPSNNAMVVGALANAQAKTRKAIESKAQFEKPNRQIASIVNRARAGDQNAMALIAMVRRNAQKGVARAAASLRLMRDYIDKHPVGPQMGSELIKPVKRTDKLRSVLCLSRGPILNTKRLSIIDASFGNEAQRKAFGYGFKRWQNWSNYGFEQAVKKKVPERYHSFIDAGATLGEARARQRLQDRNIPISEFNPMIGWELGE